MAELKKATLLAAYQELNDLAGIEPPITWKTQDQFEKELHETVVQLVEPDDEFSKETQAVFDALAEKFGVQDEQEAEDEPEVDKKPEPEGKVIEMPKMESKPTPKLKDAPKKEKLIDLKKEPKPVKNETVPELKLPDFKIENRIDALVAALKFNPVDADDWSRKTDIILTEQKCKVEPNNLSNKFDMGYLYKVAKHFDLGQLP